MALQLAPEEPEAGPWRVELLSTVVNAVTRGGPQRGSLDRPVVLAIDGRSNSGKTTLAARIVELVPGSVVIHTDDVAWAHSRFGWTDLLIDGILLPVHHGQPVSYRPPRWDEHGREGSIEVPADCQLLIIEGDGAGRREAAHLIDTLIWVQADEREAGRRAAARAADRPAADLANRPVAGAPFDEDGWMGEEISFNTAQRTWERADTIVCGTPEIAYDPSTEVVIAPPQLHPLARLPPQPLVPGGLTLCCLDSAVAACHGLKQADRPGSPASCFHGTANVTARPRVPPRWRFRPGLHAGAFGPG